MNRTMARLAVLVLLAGSAAGHAAPPVTSWSAFDDFWVNVPATGGAGDFPQSAWVSLAGQYPYLTGLTTPNAWSYAGGNLTGTERPTRWVLISPPPVVFSTPLLLEGPTPVPESATS